MAVKRWLAILLVLPGVIGVGLVGSSGPASAALPQCDGNSRYDIAADPDDPYDPYAYYRFYRPTTRNGSYNTNCLLASGSHGGGVFTLQDALRRCYHQNITVDGKFGPQTRQAVINAQNFHHLTPDGIFGPITNNEMIWPKYAEESTYFSHCWHRYER